MSFDSYKRFFCIVFLIAQLLGVMACKKEELIMDNPIGKQINNDNNSVSCVEDSIYLSHLYRSDFDFSVTRFGEGLLSPYAFGHLVQGLSIYDITMYQLFDGGYARVYDFSYETPIIVNEYALGSCFADNHAGSCQFKYYDADVARQYLYIAASNTRNCYVEQINRDTSFLVQTITAEVTDLMPDNMLLALQIGDDGHLWGNGRIGTTLYNYRFRVVNLSEGEQVTLTDSDIIDHWIVENYDISHYMRQSFKIKYGLMFFLYGNSGLGQHRGVDIYDMEAHEKIMNINLDNESPDEFEGIEVIGRNIYITTISNYGLKITLDDYPLIRDNFPNGLQNKH